jgi:hypothetical protein
LRPSSLHRISSFFAASTRRRFLVDHSKLHPYRFGANEDGLINGIAGGFGSAKDVDDIDRHSDLRQLAPHEFAEHMLTGNLRIDRQDPVPAILKEFHNPIGRAARPVRRTDHGNGSCTRQKLGDILVTGKRHAGLLLRAQCVSRASYPATSANLPRSG